MTDNLNNESINPILIAPIDEPIITPTAELPTSPVSKSVIAASPQVDSSKLNQLASNHVNNNIIVNYAGYGGAVGGGIIGLPLLGTYGGAGIIFAMIAIFFGFFIGMIPAVFTGIFVNYLNLQRNIKGLLSVTAIGSVITVLFTIIITYLMSEQYFKIPDISDQLFKFALLIGGMSAFFTGIGALPKPNRLMPVKIDK